MGRYGADLTFQRPYFTFRPPTETPVSTTNASDDVPRQAAVGFDDTGWAVVDAPHDMGRGHEASCVKSGAVGAATAVTAAPPPWHPPCLQGGMAGGDVHVANMTVAAALAYCKLNNRSQGFTAVGQWPNVQ